MNAEKTIYESKNFKVVAHNEDWNGMTYVNFEVTPGILLGDVTILIDRDRKTSDWRATVHWSSSTAVPTMGEARDFMGRLTEAVAVADLLNAYVLPEMDECGDDVTKLPTVKL